MTRNHFQPSRRTVLGGAVAALAAAGTGTAQATPGATAWPSEFPLPDGWLPEGITTGSRPYAYMGSRADGAIYRTDLRTGEGGVLHEGATGLASIGLKLDGDGLLYVAGGAGGTAKVVDARSGELLTTYQLTRNAAPFINDVVLHRDRAWFTDSGTPSSTASRAAARARSAPSRSPASGYRRRPGPTAPTAWSPPPTDAACSSSTRAGCTTSASGPVTPPGSRWWARAT